jgi:hypothetical protein
VFQQSILAYQNLVLNAQKEVEDSLVAISTSKSAVVDYSRAVIAAKSAADMALGRYVAGQNDYNTVIIAQQSLLSIQNSLVQTKSNELVGYVGAFKSLGGGWSAEMTPPKLPEMMVAEMTDRTDWGKVLTKTGEPFNVQAGKFLLPNQSLPAEGVTPMKSTTPTQGSAAP